MGMTVIGEIAPRNQTEWNFYHLDRFWKEVKRPRELKVSSYILTLLKEYNAIKIRARRKPYAKARKTQSIFKVRRRKKVDQCFVCFGEYGPTERGLKTFIHHVIAIKNGGIDLKDNRVLVCKDCHKKVHPWME